jgi:hypothetical protein
MSSIRTLRALQTFERHWLSSLMYPQIMAIPCDSVSQANVFLQQSPRRSSSESATRVNFPVSKFLVQRGLLPHCS